MFMFKKLASLKKGNLKIKKDLVKRLWVSWTTCGRGPAKSDVMRIRTALIPVRGGAPSRQDSVWSWCDGNVRNMDSPVSDIVNASWARCWFLSSRIIYKPSVL